MEPHSLINVNTKSIHNGVTIDFVLGPNCDDKFDLLLANLAE